MWEAVPCEQVISLLRSGVSVARRRVAIAGTIGAATTGAVYWHLRPDTVITPLPHTRFHRAGAGSPLVLLHGVSATWRVWSPLLPYLEPHHEVFAPTLLGHAGAPAFDSATPLSIDTLTDGVEESVDSAGITRADLVGN